MYMYLNGAVLGGKCEYDINVNVYISGRSDTSSGYKMGVGCRIACRLQLNIVWLNVIHIMSLVWPPPLVLVFQKGSCCELGSHPITAL